MKAFPSKLIPQNRHLFSDYKHNRELCKLRQKVYDYMLSPDNNPYDKKLNKGCKGFDLTSGFENNNAIFNGVIDLKMVNEIIKELNQLGWKTKLAYGNTVLFIYEKESDLPPIGDMEDIDS